MKVFDKISNSADFLTNILLCCAKYFRNFDGVIFFIGVQSNQLKVCILQKMIDADVIVLASPVYFYSISAQLKAVIDRTVARWLEVKDKEFYYITTMADEEKSSADTTLACFRGYADCVEGAAEKGVLVACGVYEPGAVRNTSAMAQAYEMGKNV